MTDAECAETRMPDAGELDDSFWRGYIDGASMALLCVCLAWLL